MKTEHESTSNDLAQVASIVGAYIEPITRFNRESLIPVGPEVSQEVHVVLELVQTVAYSIKETPGSGALPATATKLADASELQSQMQKLLAEANAQCADVLKEWVDSDPGHYERYLPPEKAFKTPSKDFGCTSVCTACSGDKKTTCTTCTGEGQNVCASCDSSGLVRCVRCHGSAKVACAGCGGSGRQSESAWESGRQFQRYRTCMHCGGVRTQACWCRNGQTVCNGCRGSGKQQCRPCSGHGTIACQSCEATGIKRLVARIKATVSTRGRPIAQYDDRAVQYLVDSNSAVRNMVSSDKQLTIDHRVDGHEITSKYTSHLTVVRAPIKVEGQTFVFYGFGSPVPIVVDYLNVVGNLLESDLSELESRLNWSFRNLKLDGLIGATQRFAESEVNILLTEHALGASDANQTEGNAGLNLLGAVDASYKDRATSAMASALAKIYCGQATPLALAMSGLLLLGSGLFYYINLWFLKSPLLSPAISIPMQISISILVAGTLLGLVVASIAMRKIRKTLPNLKPDQIETVLRYGGGFRTFQMRMGGLLIAVVLGFLVTAKWIDPHSSTGLASFSGVGKWSATFEKSRIDGRRNVFLMLGAEDAVRSSFGWTSPTMFLRCSGRNGEMFIVYDAVYIGSKGGQSTLVQTSLDNGSPSAIAWKVSTDQSAIVYPGNVVSLFNDLRQSKQLEVSLTPIRDRTITVKFDVRGIAEASKAQRDFCPWK